MATPKTKLWPRLPHTEAKHRILRRYLQAWFPIIGQSFPYCTYVDAFSGPGEYEGGEPGSPVIALHVAMECEAIRLQPTRFVLIEDDSRRVEHLREQLEVRCAPSARPPNLQVIVHHGSCENDLIPLLSSTQAWGQPIFALLDQFGGGDVTFDIVKRIAHNRSSEVVVTLAPGFFTRFVTTQSVLGDAVFGSSDWQQVANKPAGDKHDFLADEYRAALRRAGFAHTLAFQMLDEGGRRLYLLYGTTNPRGLARMKDAMWKVDPVRGLMFRDPQDPKQLAFDLSRPSFEGLERFLLERLRVRDAWTVEELRSATLEETMYRAEHVIDVLRGMRARGLLHSDTNRLTRKSIIGRTS